MLFSYCSKSMIFNLVCYYIAFFLFFRYIVDYDDPSLGKTSVIQWIVRIVFLLLQISPLLRYIDTMYYGIKSKIAAKTGGIDNLHAMLYRRMLDEDTNGALLRLFHCFLHSAPQAVLQLVILLNHTQRNRINELGTGKKMYIFYFIYYYDDYDTSKLLNATNVIQYLLVVWNS